jgi:hypothetical protein
MNGPWTHQQRGIEGGGDWELGTHIFAFIHSFILDNDDDETLKVRLA